MQDPENRISRRTALKGAAASGVGLVVGSSLAEQSLMQAGAPQEAVLGPNDEWFAQRAWSVSAN
ncbi:MAG: twin-arginine translocation signal domain-containing protein, partial [Phycisphaerales bacterium]|nr:twin-arginine translocation signal domain-containing protein [Phycisphaerales bacterium]